MSEKELTNRCRQNDNIARRELYELYAGQMLSICCRYVGDRELAQDLLHDGFLKIYRSFDKFAYRGEGSLRAWMSRVMVNISLEYLRKREVVNGTIALDELSDTMVDESVEELSIVPQSVLMKFIEELPQGYRTVFNLFVLDEKSHKEIAELLGINEKSSASQLFRAKSVLAKKIKDYLDKQ
ncbi:MAG: sigma-70 family RNA polymerase sigma factor [Bacteroidaceae bacterium]